MTRYSNGVLRHATPVAGPVLYECRRGHRVLCPADHVQSPDRAPGRAYYLLQIRVQGPEGDGTATTGMFGAWTTVPAQYPAGDPGGGPTPLYVYLGSCGMGMADLDPQIHGRPVLADACREMFQRRVAIPAKVARAVEAAYILGGERSALRAIDVVDPRAVFPAWARESAAAWPSSVPNTLRPMPSLPPRKV